MKDPLEVLSAQQGDRLDRIKTLHELAQRTAREPMAYAYLCGVELNAAKDELPHGAFEEWRERYLPDLSKATANNYRRFADALQLKCPTVGHLEPDRLITNGQIDDKAKAEILKAVHDVADGKTLTQLYRDLGVIRQPTPPGGFRPDAKAVQNWLKEHHPNLVGTKFDDVPVALRKEFQKQHKPTVDPELEAQAARDTIADAFETLMRAHDSALLAKHFHMDDSRHAELFDTWTAFLAGDLLPSMRAQSKGKPKRKRRTHKTAKALTQTTKAN